MPTARRSKAKTAATAELLHEKLSRLSRQLRSMELPPGMTPERLSALSTISANEPISVTGLADREKVRPATMSRMVSSLESDGYVRRLDDKSDGRGVLVAVTAKGRRFYTKSQKQRLQQLTEALAALRTSEIATIHKLAGSLESLTTILEDSS